MKLRMTRWLVGLSALVALVATMTGAAAAQTTTTFSGRAFAAFVNTSLTGPLTISDTGELPAEGGVQSAALLDTTALNQPALDNVLRAQVLLASTSGASGKAQSSASLADVVVLPGQPAQLTASFLRTESDATCAGTRGSTEVAELTFGGQRIEAPPGGFPANTTVTILGVATLVINEQTTVATGTHQEIRVNAIHLTVPGVAEVILSSSKSDIDCRAVTGPGPCHDFVTGGGWIDVPGGRANFGLNAGFKDGSLTPSVHLNYIDHASGKKVTATSISSYEKTGSTSRRFAGGADINGQPGSYVIDVADNGEPGRNDLLAIGLSDGYKQSGLLQGGNVQLHNPCP